MTYVIESEKDHGLTVHRRTCPMILPWRVMSMGPVHPRDAAEDTNVLVVDCPHCMADRS